MNEPSPMNESFLTLTLAAIAAIGSLGALFVSLLRLRADQRSTQHTAGMAGSLSVEGTGTVLGVPDVAYLSVSISVHARTAGDASSQCTAAMRRVLAGVRQANIADKHLRTGYLRVAPHVVYDDKQNMRTDGHDATNSLDITIVNIDQAGSLVDTLVIAGGENVQVGNLQFGFSPALAKKLHDDALRTAIGQARDQAHLIASEAGIQLGRITKIYPKVDAPYNRPRPGGRAMFFMASAAETPIESGEQAISETVSIEFDVVSQARAGA